MSRYTNYIGNNYFKVVDEEGLSNFIKEYEFGKNLLHVIPPTNIGDKWKVRFGYKNMSTDINHFDPEEQFDWFKELSEYIEEEIDFICTDEEFPVLNQSGYAYRLKCSKGQGEIINLQLNEVKE